MEPTHHVTLMMFIFADRQYVDTYKSEAQHTESDLPLAIDNVYSDLQAQVNSEDLTVLVVPIFRGSEAERLSATFPPKMIAPIRKVVV